MSNTKHLHGIASCISGSSGAHCYGTGWEVSDVLADVSYSNDINVTAHVKITSNWVIATADSRAHVDKDIRRGVNSYVKQKTEEYTRKYPDLSLGEIRINVKIHIS